MNFRFLKTKFMYGTVMRYEPSDIVYNCPKSVCIYNLVLNSTYICLTSD